MVIPKSIITLQISISVTFAQLVSSYHRLSGHSQLSDQEPTRVTKYSKSAVFQHHRRRNTNSLCLLKRGVHCYAWKQTLQAGAGWCAEEADLWPCILLPSLFLLLPPCRKEGRSLAGEKATGEHSNHRKKTKTKQKTLNISKQINKAMTKQYIYIYRYKKKKEKCAMIPVSSLHKMFTSL